MNVLTWEGLWDDLILYNNVWNLGFNLDSFPGQLSEDLLTEQNVLSRLKLHMPRLGTFREVEERRWQDEEKSCEENGKKWKRIKKNNNRECVCQRWCKFTASTGRGSKWTSFKNTCWRTMSCFCVLNRTSFGFWRPSEQVDSSKITNVWRLFLNGHLKT